MCEMLGLSAPSPIPIADALRWARLLERFGVAGFGWGIAWADGDAIRRYRSVSSLREDDEASSVLAGISTNRLIIHLRRPSLMTSVSHENAQPYLDQETGAAFAHNGFLRRHNEYRPRYADRLRGTSDSEVGFRMWADRIAGGEAPGSSLAAVAQALEGHANLIALTPQGPPWVCAANPDNPLYTFRAGALSFASTALHSLDDYLFQAIFPQASDVRRLAPNAATASL